MQIDFTKFDKPVDALDLSRWTVREIDDNLADDEEIKTFYSESTETGLTYEIPPGPIDFRFTPEHRIATMADSVSADVRADGSLVSIVVHGEAMEPAKLVPFAEQLVKDWNLHSFKHEEDLPFGQEPAKIDSLQLLSQWVDDPEDVLPNFLAQTDANPMPGIWFLRVVINAAFEHEGQYIMSTQVFWRGQQLEEGQVDEGFEDRASEVIELANKQAEDVDITLVAESLLYAAARYNAFDYWTCFDGPEDFEKSKEEAVEHYVDQFREMLLENLQDHKESYEQLESE